ncbi:MAG: MarR family winged helix-turn-helix transcriptional regulator [Candidatus Dormibacteria bacterium]
MTTTVPAARSSTAHRAELIDASVGHVGELMRLRRAHMTARPCPRDVSLPQFWILMMLRDGRITTMRGIADALEITPSSLTAIIDRLEQRGLVTRSRDDDDRRVVHIERTPEGELIVQEMVGMKQQHIRSLVGQLTEPEIAALEQGLAAVLRVLGDGEPTTGTS